MKHIDSDPLHRALSVMAAEIGRLADNFDPAGGLDDKAGLNLPVAQLERYARAMAAHIKVIAEIETHNRQVAVNSDSEKYIAYEDLPPPNPDERQRVIQRVLALAARFETGAKLSESGGAGAPQ
jgi:hypothetical protein